MLKRLPFALLAISFSVPVVACLNTASEEATAGDANMLTDADKAACNFGFSAVAADAADPELKPRQDKGVTGAGKAFLFGDVNGDNKVDLLLASAKGEVSLFPGKGDGRFDAAVKSTIGIPTNTTAKALALVGMGDFDGDGKQDFVAVQTVFDGAGLENVGHYVIAYGKADGSFDTTRLPFAIRDNNAKALTSWSAIADFDGDHKSDLAVGGEDGETVFFGEATRKPKALPSGAPQGGGTAIVTARQMMFAAGKNLVIANKTRSWNVSFANDRTPTAVESALTLPEHDMDAPTDLDGNGSPELTMIQSAKNKLSIKPLAANADAKTFVHFPGTVVDNADFGLDLAHDGKHQLLFKTDARKLFAACGYSADTNEIVAVELPVSYGTKTMVAGTPDLNGDGKPDLLTFQTESKTLKVFLGAAPPATLPAQISYYVDGYTPPSPDAGPGVVDAGPPQDDGSVIIVTDAGPGEVDAGPEPVDAGPGPVDAGPPVKDAGPPVKDAGPPVKDAGPPPPKDAGTKDSGTTTGDDDDDDDTVGDDDDDNVTPPKDKPKTNPSSSSSSGSTSGTITVKVTPKNPPEDDDGGCSTTGSSSNSSGSVALGALAMMFVLGNRRRNKKA